MKLCLFLLIVQVTASAQWLHYREPGIPRTKDGKPDLAAAAPKTHDGKPDLSGIWDPAVEVQDLGDEKAPVPSLFLDITHGVKPGDAAMLPAAQGLFDQRRREHDAGDPLANCKPIGVPRVEFSPSPIRIVQSQSLVVVLHEAETSFREIHVDGRALPDDPQPAWMGYSTAKWEGDTLVVETAGFPDNGWLDAFGHPHSDSLRLTERIRRSDFGHMEIRITIDDPKMYRKPFTSTQKYNLVPDSDLIEYFCTENERDSRHYVIK